MSLRVRIIIFLVIIFVGVILKLAFELEHEQQQLNAFIDKTKKDKAEVFDKIIEMQGANLKAFTFDNSFRDDMLSFVKTKDSNWAKKNIEEIIPIYNFQYIWVLNDSLNQVYSFGVKNYPSIKENPIPDSSINKLISNPFNHFFVPNNEGLLEIRVAPIQPGDDFKRVQQASGYMITGRLWTEKHFEELSKLMLGKVTYAPYDYHVGEEYRENEFVILTEKQLYNINGISAGELKCITTSKLLYTMSEDAYWSFTLSVLFGSITIILLSLFLFYIIEKPLTLIARSLESENPDILGNLDTKKNEFGSIALLIKRFFEQKKKLALAKEEAEDADKAKSNFIGNINTGHSETETVISNRKNSKDGKLSNAILNPDIIKYLNSEIKLRWLKVKENMLIDEIDDFASELESIGSQNKCSLLTEYGNELKRNTESLNINQLTILLNSFPDLLHKVS